MNNDSHGKRLGTFDVIARKVMGEVELAGPNTFAYLFDHETFTVPLSEPRLTGVLHDLSKVTLLDCIPLQGPIRGERHGVAACSWRLFPHFVVVGDRHLDPTLSNVEEVTFTFEDARALFYDFDAFGVLLDAAPFIKDIVRASNSYREVATGDSAVLAYFAGAKEIVRLQTRIGLLTVSHSPSVSGGGPSGARIENTILVTIRPQQPIDFGLATDHVLDVLRLFELLIGRPQELSSFWIGVTGGIEEERPMRVHWSMGPRRSNEDIERRTPHPGDVLVSAVQDKTEFSAVAVGWLASDVERKNARCRFSGSFGQGNRYDIDRLVGAANMFDILPVSAAPKDIVLSAEMADAQSKCRAMFSELKPSDAGMRDIRQSMLGHISRMGRSSLKQKVRYRARALVELCSERFPDLELVLNEAVECRNYFVHGSPTKIDYGDSDYLSFFVDVLEFVFAAGELVEAGWDVVRWCKTGTCMTHPFGRTRIEYPDRVTALKRDLEAAKLAAKGN